MSFQVGHGHQRFQKQKYCKNVQDGSGKKYRNRNRMPQMLVWLHYQKCLRHPKWCRIFSITRIIQQMGVSQLYVNINFLGFSSTPQAVGLLEKTSNLQGHPTSNDSRFVAPNLKRSLSKKKHMAMDGAFNKEICNLFRKKQLVYKMSIKVSHLEVLVFFLEDSFPNHRRHICF